LLHTGYTPLKKSTLKGHCFYATSSLAQYDFIDRRPVLSSGITDHPEEEEVEEVLL